MFKIRTLAKIFTIFGAFSAILLSSNSSAQFGITKPPQTTAVTDPSNRFYPEKITREMSNTEALRLLNGMKSRLDVRKSECDAGVERRSGRFAAYSNVLTGLGGAGGTFVAIATVAGTSLALSPIILPTALVVGITGLVFKSETDNFKNGALQRCNLIYQRGKMEIDDAIRGVERCAEQSKGVILTIGIATQFRAKPGVLLTTDYIDPTPPIGVECQEGQSPPLYSNLYAQGPITITDDGGTVYFNPRPGDYTANCYTLQNLRSNGWTDYFNPRGQARISLNIPAKTYSIGWQSVNTRFFTSASGTFTYSSQTNPPFSANDTVTVDLQASSLTADEIFGRMKYSFPGGTVTLSKFRPDGSGYQGNGTMLVTGINWPLRIQKLSPACDITLQVTGSVDGIPR
jgi:hypothetical protein